MSRFRQQQVGATVISPILDSYTSDPNIVTVARARVFGDKRINASGGVATAQVHNRPFRQDFTQRNFTGGANGNDTLIVKTRDYLYRRPTYIKPGDGGGNHSWTADGPSRDLPTTRFNRNYRPLVGGGHREMWGQHTNIQSGAKQGNQLVGKPAMRVAGQNRLTVQRYRGQTYSQTTQLAGQ